MVSGRSANGELDACFRSLMLSISSGRGQAEGGGAMPTLSGWKDLPIELLLRIMSIIGDDRMLVVASGVCTGWRDALGWGLTNLSLSRWARFLSFSVVLSIDGYCLIGVTCVVALTFRDITSIRCWCNGGKIWISFDHWKYWIWHYH